MISRSITVDRIKDAEVREQIKELQEEALGNIIQLEKAPTASAPLIEANTIGEFEDKLYFRIGQTILVFTTSSTITIT